MTTRTGSCQCGEIRYQVEGEYLAFGVCYCTECQKVSSGFSTYSMMILRSQFHLLAGQLKQWERRADSGNRNVAHMCPHCGNRIFHEDPDHPEMVRIKAGTLDELSQLEPQFHLWVNSAPAWVQIPEGSYQHPQQPDLAEFKKQLEQQK